jgi:ATP-dependent Clp protease ATP-binding subunit ClpA
MIDINTILTQALTTAVAEAMLPLQQEYATLTERIAALEAQLAQAAPAPQIDATKPLVERIAALEKHTAVLDQHGGILEYLDNQEWFWEKVRRFADAAAEAHMEAHLEQANHLDEDDINSLIETAIDYHEENRTHGDEDDIEEMVQKLLNGASISISV